MGRRNACRASDAIRSGIRYAKWAGGSRSQTHRRAAKGGFTQDDGYVRGLAPTHDRSSSDPLLLNSSDLRLGTTHHALSRVEVTELSTNKLSV